MSIENKRKMAKEGINNQFREDEHRDCEYKI